jgi:hypothetical protein
MASQLFAELSKAEGALESLLSLPSPEHHPCDGEISRVLHVASLSNHARTE